MYRDDSGQATAEYALVIVAAALIALALIVVGELHRCARGDLRHCGPAGARHRRTMIRRDSGSAVAEFAIVLPLVLVVLVASVELVSVARVQLEVTQAAREGARHAATNVDPAAGGGGGAVGPPSVAGRRRPGQRHPPPSGGGPGRSPCPASLPLRCGPVRRHGRRAVRPGGDASRAVKSAVGGRPSAISQRTMLAAAAVPFPQGRVAEGEVGMGLRELFAFVGTLRAPQVRSTSLAGRQGHPSRMEGNPKRASLRRGQTTGRSAWCCWPSPL